MINYYGYNPPFFGGHQNVLSKQTGDRLIKNDLVQLILTSRGERVMRPFWGTVVRGSLFETMTESLLSTIEQNITDTIRTYEPRIKATAQATQGDNNTLNIKIVGVYTDQPNRTFEMELNLPLSNG